MAQNEGPSDFAAIETQTAGFSAESQRAAISLLVATHQQEIREESGFVRPALVALPGDPTVMVTPARVLVPSEHAPAARAILDPAEWNGPHKVPCKASKPLKVVRFDGAGSHPDPAAAVDVLVKSGVPANFSYITPAGPFVKGAAPPFAPSGTTPAWPSGRRKKAGTGVRIAVIDTGVNLVGSNWNTTWLRDLEFDAIDTDPLDADKNGTLDDGAGHGTFVAGVIRQLALNAHIRVYRALDSFGIGSEEAVACAILRAADDGADIINLSLGSETYRDLRPVALDAALRALPEHVVVVAAAGNSGDRRPVWPAAFPEVIAVGALDEHGRPATWSSHGGWVSCAVRGSGIVSTFVSGTESNAAVFSAPEPWALWSGTSFAAPQVAALIAIGADGRTVKESAQALMAAGTPIPDFGVELGYALPYTLA